MEFWQKVCPFSDELEERPFATQVGKSPVAVYRIGNACFALHDVCSHSQAKLSEGFFDGEAIECPLHQAQFDVRNGACVSVPEYDPVRIYDVKVEGGDVFVKVPEDD